MASRCTGEVQIRYQEILHGEKEEQAAKESDGITGLGELRKHVGVTLQVYC